MIVKRWRDSRIQIFIAASHRGANAQPLGIFSRSIGVPLMDLPIKKNVLLCCISRHGKIIIPSGRDSVEIGDTVVVVTTNKGMNDFKDILA